MKKKSFSVFIRTLFVSVFMIAFAMFISTSVFAASAKLGSSYVTAQKGDSLSGNKLIITLNKAEISFLKDSMTLTLDGASWEGYSSEGVLDTNITYKIASDSVMEIHISPTESMLTQDLVINVPLNCRVLYDQAEISATLGYNLDGYTDGRYVFARCSYSRAVLNGNIMERKTGEEIFASNGSAYYNNLRIYIIGNDVERTKNSITVTLDGMTWSRLNDSGSVKNSASVAIMYKKLDKNTISLQVTNYTPHMTFSGYNITIPLTGTVTGTGDLKATVDFGVDGTSPSEVVFGYCSGGDITLTAASPDSAVNNIGKVSDITINDTTEQTFKKNTKFTLTLQQTYSFYQAPEIEATGKYEGKCSAVISEDNLKQCIITLTDAVLGETGTIKLKNVILEKAASNTPKSDNLTITFNGTGRKEYESTVSIGKYSAEAEYNPPLRMSTSNIYAAANYYVRTGTITFTDNGSDRNYSAGDKIVMTFDNGFYWFTEGTAPVLTATGKFSGACSFEFNTENKKEAYIVFNKNITSQSAGTISLNSISALRDSEGYFETLKLTAYIDGEPTTSNTIQAGRYSAVQTGELTAAPAAAEESSDLSEETETASDSINVKFIIGETSYYVGDNQVALSAAPYIKDGFTMLPVRVLANMAGINDDGISFSDGTAIFSRNGQELLVISAGETAFTLLGEEKELSTSAEVKDGTMFLPMRELINAFGIPDENISYDAETKTVTIIVTE